MLPIGINPKEIKVIQGLINNQKSEAINYLNAPFNKQHKDVISCALIIGNFDEMLEIAEKVINALNQTQ